MTVWFKNVVAPNRRFLDGWRPIQGQFLNAVDDPANAAIQVFLLRCPDRQVGKTVLMLNLLNRECVRCGGITGLYVAPTYQIARQVGWEGPDGLLAWLPAIPFLRVDHRAMMVSYPNGSTLRVVGCGYVEDVARGYGFTVTALDQAELMPESIWRRWLLPGLLASPGSRAFIVYDPDVDSWVAQVTSEMPFVIVCWPEMGTTRSIVHGPA